MASWIDVANSALIKLGSTSIGSFSEDNEKARVTGARWEACRDYVLGEHPWKCARARASLASLTSTPAFGYTNEFQLPSDYLTLVSVDVTDYQKESNKILANASQLNISYTKRVSDPNELTTHVRECIAFYLAYDIAYFITQDASRQQTSLQQYKQAFARAQLTEAREQPNKTWSANRLVNVRLEGHANV